MAIWDRLLGRGPDIEAARRGRPPNDPARHSRLFTLMQVGNQLDPNSTKRRATKPTPKNLRVFSRTVYGRRAINAIKNPIVDAAWEIAPKEGVEMNSLLQKQIEIATTVFETPNETDSFRVFLEQVLEDTLVSGGAIEIGVSGNSARPLFMWPVDGLTIEAYPGWKPGSDSPRWAQRVTAGITQGGTGGEAIPFKDDELIYIRPNPTTSSPFGFAPLEVAFNSISHMLGVADFAGKVSSNSRPSIGLDLGDGATQKIVSQFREYWRQEVEGQGNMPIFAMEGDEEGSSSGRQSNGAKVLRFYPEGDAGLYLKYQDFLKAEIAISFDLSPMNLGVERDVNRSTADVAAERDNELATKPWAHVMEDYLSLQVLNRHLGFSQLRFRFRGLDIKNQLAMAQTFDLYYQDNVYNPNEIRKFLGAPPSKAKWAVLNNADVEIEIVKENGKLKDPAGRPASAGKRPNELK